MKEKDSLWGEVSMENYKSKEETRDIPLKMLISLGRHVYIRKNLDSHCNR